MKELSLICQTLRQTGRLPAVLATLVSVRGSSYRRPGARLLIAADGTRAGAISGGCLEEDVVARARQVASTGEPELLTYDTSAENDLVWGVGLGCHGVVQVLLERLDSLPRWVPVLKENIRRRQSTTLAVTWASDPAAAAPAFARGTRIIETGEASEAGAGVFVETLPPPTQLLVFGAGDDARPLVRFAREIGWQVAVADPRPAYASASRFPEAGDVRVIQPGQPLAAQGIIVDAHTVAVVMTHHYVHDVPLLRQLLPQNLPYLGLLGPKARADRILADLAADGCAPSAAQRQGLHAPVGLDLGATTPETVALSIVAEIHASLRARDGRPLRERTQPIHA